MTRVSQRDESDACATDRVNKQDNSFRIGSLHLLQTQRTALPMSRISSVAGWANDPVDKSCLAHGAMSDFCHDFFESLRFVVIEVKVREMEYKIQSANQCEPKFRFAVYN